MQPTVFLESHTGGCSYAFSGLRGEVVARAPIEVMPALDAAEQAVADGLHAAGFLSYEAAPGLDAALKTHPGGDFPLVWFGLFETRAAVAPEALGDGGRFSLSGWQPSISRAQYDAALLRIRDYIAAGDAYQVNYTFRMCADFKGDARAFYRRLCRAQRTDFSAFLDVGRFQILSASPELFFSLKDGVLTARPMKGTALRGRFAEEDDANAAALRTSEKDRAENVMIVDLLRNDLGRVSIPGSVCVPALWEVERYETVLQMTSTVRSHLREGVGFGELIQALFPCGSITGAPKIRAMEIVKALEDGPRGIYTGCIGYVSPGGEMGFNVAIHTVCIDRDIGTATFGVGGGVTYDSSSDGEYEECATKAAMVTVKRPDFELFETLRWDEGKGFFLLDQHLNRLSRSARYFGFALDRDRALGRLGEAVDGMVGTLRVRLVLSRDGAMGLDVVAMAQPEMNRVFRVRFAAEPVDSRDVFLFHKTTHREMYESRRMPDCDEVILINERGEVTECCIGNLVVMLDGECVTPPARCGLLGGTFREALLARGHVCERVVKPDDVRRAEGLYMVNSVREWVSLTLID